MNEKILEELKKIVMITGQLSSVHINTLKIAPLIFFDNLLSVKITYNIDTENNGTSVVNFELIFNPDHKKDDLWEKRIEALKNTVKTILWPDIKINITETVET